MIAQGIHPGLGMSAYHAWKLDKSKLIDGPISCSVLKAFFPNPYAWLHSPDQQQTDAMRIGNLFDLAVTSPSFWERVELKAFDNYRTKEAREWRDEVEASGKVIATEEEADKALKAAQEVKGHAVAGHMVDGAEFQVGVVGEIGGIPAKCLIDIIPNEDSDHAETLVDYKTTSNGITDEEIARTIGKFLYHWQAAYYRTLTNKVHALRHFEDFAFIFQDIGTLEVRAVKLNDDALTMGGRSVKAALEEFRRCATKGIGSRYAKRYDEIGLPVWQSMNEDESLAKLEGVFS